MTHSLAYRRHEAAIWNGRAPDKYMRVLPHVTGRCLLEIGSAEGVLSLLLADRDPDATVTALEMRHDRCHAALALQARWASLGHKVEGCQVVCGDIRDRSDLLHGVETLVAIRTIYHLRHDIESVLSTVAQVVPHVVLGGNPGRAKRYATNSLPPDDALGPFNFYAGVEGMTSALERAGYRIGTVVSEGDPIVTGYR